VEKSFQEGTFSIVEVRGFFPGRQSIFTLLPKNGQWEKAAVPAHPAHEAIDRPAELE